MAASATAAGGGDADDADPFIADAAADTDNAALGDRVRWGNAALPAAAGCWG
eukprot:gene15334-20095_t